MESAPQLTKFGLVVIIGAFAVGAGAAAAAVLATPRSTCLVGKRMHIYTASPRLREVCACECQAFYKQCCMSVWSTIIRSSLDRCSRYIRATIHHRQERTSQALFQRT
jgi:hypothetical protein